MTAAQNSITTEAETQTGSAMTAHAPRLIAIEERWYDKGKRGLQWDDVWFVMELARSAVGLDGYAMALGVNTTTVVPDYVVDPLAPFPKRWRDPTGPISVMAGPCKGWLMVRRPGAAPFCLRVSDLCNATRLSPHGPFEVIGKTIKPVRGIEAT